MMAKQAGLGDNFYYGGYDLSGDVASIDSMSAPINPLEATGLKQSAHQRLFGLRDSAWSFTTLFENASAVSNPGVPSSTTPLVSTYNFYVLVTITGGTLTNVSINGVTAGTGDGTYLLPPLGTITLTYSVAPTWNWVAVGTEHNALSPLSRNDQIAMYFRGTGAVGQPVACINAKQLDYDPTRGNDGSLSLKVDLQANSFGMEWGVGLTAGLRTDITGTTGSAYDQGATLGTTNFGAQAYLEITGLVGTSADVQIQHCTTSGGSYTTLIDFGSQTGIGGFRQAVSNVTAVNEFLKVVTSGTFTYLQFAVMFNRNVLAGQVF
jgi:hypothetical protein